MAMMGEIRWMYFRDQLSVSEIARRTSMARNTIKKWLRAARGVEPRYRRGAKPGKLTAFEAQLIQALRVDAHRPKRERRTALKAQITEQGYCGGFHDLRLKVHILKRGQRHRPVSHFM
jgi:transposase